MRRSSSGTIGSPIVTDSSSSSGPMRYAWSVLQSDCSPKAIGQRRETAAGTYPLTAAVTRLPKARVLNARRTSVTPNAMA